MELEKGNAVPRDDPLDLEEGELREDQAATVATADSAEMEVEADQKPPAAAAEEEEEEENGKSSEKRRHGKRRSESGDANGEHDKKRSKKKSKKDNNSKRGGGGGDKGDDEEGTSTHKQHGDGAPDGEGDRRKRKEERSSANHHRDDHHSRHHHHRDHKDHKDRKDRHRDRGKHERSSSSSSASDDRRASEEERHSSSRSERERSRHSSSRERERERDSDGRGGRDGERGDRGRSSSREDRHHHHARRRDDEPRHGGGERQHERDRRGHERVEEREDHRHRGAAGEHRYEREHERGRDDRDDGRYDRGEDQRDHRRRDDHRHHRAGGYERGDDRRDRRSVEPAAERKPHERDDAKANQTDDADYARMVEEELRRKEKEQSEEEKTQKLIEERRKRRQAILEKYKQDKSAPADTAATATTAAGDKAAAKSEEAQAADAAAGTSEEKPKEEEEKEEEKGTDEGKEKAEEGKPAQEQPEEPKKVTHFDMFNELPPALIPSDQKMQRPLGAAAATGEDELNLADNWDDEEGYYSFRIGEVINRRYTVHASHGKGVFSTVLIAKDSHNNDIDVAIKVIRNNDTMFRAGLKEKELLEKITAADPEDKKHCIRVLDSFQYRNHLCLVLEPMSMNLREVVKKFGRDVGITMRAVRTYARQLFLALKHLKKLNMLHADLKPDNIVLNAKLTVLKLCDFGSASLMEEENAITPYLVSRFYRAPEIMLGLPYDFGIDMWAAGCCLYEMYTGKILYAGKSNNEMLRMQMESMGPFPRKMLRKSKFWQRHFNTQTFYFQQICIDEVSQQEYVKEVNVVKPVRDLKAELQKAATAEDVSHAGQLADLMLKCLNLDPAKRLTPELALAHPFLKG